MPRVRVTAGRWRAAALVAVAVCARPALAQGPDRRSPAPQPAAAAPRPGEIEGRRRDEIDALQRQDATEALKKYFNISIDWRTTSLDRLVDIRVRAAKAAELQQRLGVTVDWQRYSWIELEALRRTLISFERYRDQHTEPAIAIPAPHPLPLGRGPDTDGLVKPTFKGRTAARAGQTTDPDGIIRPTFNGRAPAPASAATDPDGVIRPTFGVHPRWSFASDPDGLIAPTFVPFRRVSTVGDADGLIGPTAPTGTHGGHAAPARW